MSGREGRSFRKLFLEMTCIGHASHLRRVKKSLRLPTLPPCRGRVCSTWCELGSGWVETPVTPDEGDEPGVLDDGDVVEGLGADGLASGRRVVGDVW